MTKRVRCILPGGRSHVLMLNSHLTLHTFQAAARNLLNTSCKHTTLRHGAPPDYVSVPLSGEVSTALLHIRDKETVWIDVCPLCREREQRLWQQCCDSRPSNVTPPRKVTTLRDIQTDHSYPPFNKQQLGHGGYYYSTAARECGLEHFSVYVFSNAPHLQFLYSTQLDSLLELPPQLAELREHSLIPCEFMVPGGFLYHLLSTHMSLKHMNFYTVSMLPGRILVYDAGLNMLTETHSMSELTLSLFPGTLVDESSMVLTSISADGDSAILSGDDTAAEHVVKCWKMAAGGMLESSPSASESVATRGVTQQTQQSHTHQAPPPGIHVYEPTNLNVTVPTTHPQTRCHLPPCVYMGVDTDPR